MTEYIIVGTAGHVDHGKTVLVKALTGVDTDRLKEEKERGISIELGFAPLELPSGRRLGLVDVPGHERFLRQMLAGVAGIDLVLLVIAADEGVMPQTREHLEIIDLLEVKRGVIALTKVDLVDEEWLELVKEEVRVATKGSVLENSPMVCVSAPKGIGLQELLTTLDAMAAETTPKSSAGYPRLPIDRMFSITGFGTVVTGTLWSGKVKVGEQVVVLPVGINSRIRSLQVHGRQVLEAVAGQRVAINLPGVDAVQINRGDTVARPGTMPVTRRMDVHLTVAASLDRSLEQRERVHLYLGTSEVIARVTLIGREEVEPSDHAFAQLVLEKPVVAVRGDRFILRSYSPMMLVGGGIVVDSFANRHKTSDAEIEQSLERRFGGAAREAVLETLLNAGHIGFIPFQELAVRTSTGQAELKGIIEKLVNEDKVIQLTGGEAGPLVTLKTTADYWAAKTGEMLSGYHVSFPLRPGMPKEELRSRLLPFLTQRSFLSLLDFWGKSGDIAAEGNWVASPDFTPSAPVQKGAIDKVEAAFREGGFQPPEWSEVRDKTGLPARDGEEVLHYLLREGILIKVSDDVLLHREILEEAKKRLLELFQSQEQIGLGEVRDALGSSRKYILPLLEYFDRNRLTRRIGDKRVLY